MINFPNKELDDFLSLFEEIPSISILDINTNLSTISNKMQNFVNNSNGTLLTLNHLKTTELKARIKRSNYDYVIVSNSFLDQENQNIFMKLLSMGLRDYGHIIIIEPKDKSIDTIYSLLEEFDYGATSCIDIFDGYHLIMARKLHMWGMD